MYFSYQLYSLHNQHLHIPQAWGRIIPKPKFSGVFEVPKDPLDGLALWSPQGRLEPGVESHCEMDLQSHRREVEEGANHAPVLALVHLLSILVRVQSIRHCHRCRHWFSISHVKLLQQVLCVLHLVHECIILVLLNLDAVEEGQLTHYRRLKLALYHILKSWHKSMTQATKNYIIHIYLYEEIVIDMPITLGFNAKPNATVCIPRI